jgi:hypothetical protein
MPTDPHPCLLREDELLATCQMRMTRRSGPGGQHRNKTSSAVVLTHLPSGRSAEGSERRSQADNRRVALRRLRERLAVELRTDPADNAEQRGALRQRYGGARLRVAADNADRPAVVAVLLDDLHAAEGETAAVAQRWTTTASQLVRLLRDFPGALEQLNAWRSQSGRRPLQ